MAEELGVESLPGDSNPAIWSLVSHAEICFKELVAFHEVITKISQEEDRAVSNWFSENERFLNKDTRREFREKLGDFLEQLGRTLANSSGSQEGQAGAPDEVEIPGIDVPDRELQAIFESFFIHIGHRLRDRTEMISRAFLIAAESSFEVLFGQIVRTIYVKNPSALPKSDHSFTLDELSAYSSIEEAREALIAQKTEALLRESVDEWVKWLKRTINIALDQVMSDWATTREIFTRRNMLVHTDGLVTKRYLNQLQRAGKGIEGLSEGQSLAPSVSYLQDSLQRLVALELILVVRVWSRLEKHQLDIAVNWLNGKVEFVVINRMWEATCLVSDAFEGATFERSAQLAMQIDGWIAHKYRDGLDYIFEEVSSWDVSALDKWYTLAKKLLLDSLSAEELADALSEGIITQFEVSTHPLFDSIRELNPPNAE